LLTKIVAFVLLTLFSGCGHLYVSPTVKDDDSAQLDVRVLKLSMSVLQEANRSEYVVRQLPSAFNAVVSGDENFVQGHGTIPRSVLTPEYRPSALELRLPPEPPKLTYRIGVGDVVQLVPRQIGNETISRPASSEPSGLMQSYTIPESGKITLPGAGSVNLLRLTTDEASKKVIEALVRNRIDAPISIEITGFNSQKVTIGGAVKRPGIVPITLTPVYLDEALSSVGGVAVADDDFAVIRIYRDGNLYQIPLKKLYDDRKLLRVRLQANDSIFVDTTYDLNRAQAYFTEQIQLAQFRQQLRVQELSRLETAIDLKSRKIANERAVFLERLELGDIKQDYVLLVGEVTTQKRISLPFGNKAYLAEIMYAGDGIPTKTGDLSQVYVLRSYASDTLIAYHLNAQNIVNLALATKFEMRPNDIIFIAEQKITKWDRVISQATPQLINLVP